MLFQRFWILLAAIVIVATAAISLGRGGFTAPTVQGSSVTFLQVCTVMALGFAVISVIYIFVSARPHDYPKLGNAMSWRKWRSDYSKSQFSEDVEEEVRSATLAKATRDAMLEKMLEAQSELARINQKRRKAFQGAVSYFIAAVVALGVQAIAALKEGL